MDYVIEVHINNHDKVDYQARLFKTEDFKKYIDRIKNGESFIVRDIFDKRWGTTLPIYYDNFKVLREDENNFVFTITLPIKRGMYERTIYLNKVYSDENLEDLIKNEDGVK